MDQKLHFISGLPRSGSTLLGALLRQNPRFHASMSSPVGGLFRANQQMLSAGSEMALLTTTEQRECILKSLFTAFYAGHADREVIFDTNRIWTARLPALLKLFPGAKVIATVRNLAWVMDSLERLLRAAPLENTRLFGSDGERANVYTRVETLAKPDRLVGSAYLALRDGFYSEHSASLLVIDYDRLAKRPLDALQQVYDFIGEPEYDHDPENVVFDAPEFDAALGIEGMHHVRPKVAFMGRRSVLPPDLFEKYNNYSFWLDPGHTDAQVIAKPGPLAKAVGSLLPEPGPVGPSLGST